ncbi:MAG TPA: murein biosynthesis integral membrane protein MurJ [Bryobacteraceae bacterium]|nr:murein biosynthesis integral membrane protein MurJ [Bryobacteraceae bacterium]HPU73431.1 murein biosynthesis integral membrane protein MurJ [Bryobacteraceae bacterium]
MDVRAVSEPAPGAHDETAGHEQIVRAAGVVSAAVLLSRLSGLLRETVMAHLFGAGRLYDAFSLGFRIPNLTRDLFAEGALSSAFVPTFTEYLSTKSKREAAELSNLVGTAVILIVGALCVLGAVFSPFLVSLLAPGWETADPEKFELAIALTRIMFPFLLVVALAAQAMGVLNACGQFAVPALASTFFNIGSVAFGVGLGFWLGPHLGIDAITGMAFGVVLGGVLQLLWQLPALFRLGFRFRPRLNWSHPGLVRIIRMMGPAIIGSAAVQVNVVVNTNFASTIVDPLRGLDGPVSWLQYAFRFMQLPLGLFGVAIAAATLPSISRSAANGNIDEFRRTLSRSLGTVLLLTVPSSIGLVILGNAMIGLIYQGRKFEAYDTHQTAVALSYYAIGLAGYAAVKVLAPAFYALGSARIPALVSIASILINFVVAWTFTHKTQLGHAGLALATSGVSLFASVALFLLIRKRIGGVHGRALLASTLKIGVAALVMGAIVVLCRDGLQGWLGVTRFARLVELAVCIPLGVAVFGGLCRAFRVAELEMASRAVIAPLARWRAG